MYVPPIDTVVAIAMIYKRILYFLCDMVDVLSLWFTVILSFTKSITCFNLRKHGMKNAFLSKFKKWYRVGQ